MRTDTPRITRTSLTGKYTWLQLLKVCLQILHISNGHNHKTFVYAWTFGQQEHFLFVLGKILGITRTLTYKRSCDSIFFINKEVHSFICNLSITNYTKKMMESFNNKSSKGVRD